MEPFKWELHLTAAAFVEECAGEIEYLKEIGVIPADAPALGEILAIDATDIPAYARPRGEHCDPPGEGNCKKKHRTHCDSPDPDRCTKHQAWADPDAAWGYRTPKNRSPQAETGRKEYFFGYDADVITDAYYGLPLYVNVRPANLNEVPGSGRTWTPASSCTPGSSPSTWPPTRAITPCTTSGTSRTWASSQSSPFPSRQGRQRQAAARGAVHGEGPARLHRRAGHGVRGDRGGRGAPVPLSAGGLSPQGQDGLEPLLRLRLLGEAGGDEAADNGHGPPGQRGVEGDIQEADFPSSATSPAASSPVCWTSTST